MNSPATTKTRRTIYTGHVQGVGFRYTTSRIARQFPVTGYVRNLADGTVELVAQGDSAALDQFHNAIADHFTDNIHDCQNLLYLTDEIFDSFKIRR